MKYLATLLLIIAFSKNAISNDLNVFGLGIYDVKFDGSDTNQTTDIRYEKRFDKVLFDIGPEEDNFFFLKPFLGFEYTGDSASYIMSGIYLEDNLGELFTGNESNYIFTPSFAVGYYDEGSGKKLGNDIEFRTSFELSYILKNNNRLGFSISHISNANLGDKNPGVEVISLSYQVPF
tara:strand:+ start:82 stop:612 length:531 start_codon:yes stop_codon:yes gene_type:complete